MFSFGSGPGPVPAPPPPCRVCGALPLQDHAKDCPVLRAIRAQDYPEVIDDNGRPWYLNALAKRDEEIAALKQKLDEA